LLPSARDAKEPHPIHFGDLDDRDSEVSRLIRERQGVRAKEELGTEPNVIYLL
jgi:molybdopterin-containing oxidoreductase family iron-sulfur binding subunit